MSDRVLVVEDNKRWQRILTKDLTKVGYDVAVASTLDEAIAMLEKEMYHVVVTDIGLTEEADDDSGIELLQLIKQQYPTITTLAISGRSVAGLDKERFKSEYEVLDYIKRVDYNKHKFINLVATAVDQSKQAMEMRRVS